MFDKEDEYRIKAIIFDIDGTIYSNFFMILVAPYQYLRNMLWIYRFAKMRRKLRASIQYSNTPLSQSLKEDFDKKCISYFKDIIHEDESVAKIILETHIYSRWIQAIRRVPLRYNFRSILRMLKKKGYKLGILSDFRLQEKLSAWNLHAYFDDIICAEDYGVLKPDLRIFQLICDNLGVKAQETVFVGNHLKYDGIGAARAGLHSLLFYKKNINIESKYDISSFYTMCGFKKKLEAMGLI